MRCWALIGFLGLGVMSLPAAKSAETGALFMEMERRVGALEETVQDLTGKIEELQHALKTGKMLGDGASGPSGAGPASALPGVGAPSLGPSSPSGAPTDVPFAKARSSEPGKAVLPGDGEAPQTEQEAYDHARKLLGQGAYEEAEAAFKSFIDAYKNSPLVVNAQYWLGETYYSRQDYARSSVAFMEAYKTYRAQLKNDGAMNRFAKAPESLIKLIFSLKGLGKEENACKTYKQLRKEFPKLPSNLERLANRSLEGLKCT